MKLVQIRPILLILACIISSLYAFDESKGTPPAGKDVLLRLGGQELLISADLLQQFELLAQLREMHPELDILELPQNEIFSEEQITKLQNLLDFMVSGELLHYSGEQLLDLIYLADYLGVREPRVTLLPLLVRLKQIVTLEMIKRVKDLPPLSFSGLVDDIGLPSNLPYLHNVKQIIWLPNTKFYFTEFHDGWTQLYDLAGNKIGASLFHLNSISWNSHTRQYMTIYFDIEAGSVITNIAIYDLTGHQVLMRRLVDDQVDRLELLDSPEWQVLYAASGLKKPIEDYCSPNELYRLVRVEDRIWGDKFYLYGADGSRLSKGLSLVSTIVWSSDSSHYWVIFADGRAQMYDMHSFNHLPFYQQLLVQYILTQFNIDQKPVALAPDYLGLLDSEIVVILSQNGFLLSGSIVSRATQLLASMLAWRWY